MKHTIEFKLPWSRKKSEEDLDGSTEIVVKNRDISKVLTIGVPLAIGLTAGYLIGFNRGVNKNTNITIIK